MTPEVLTLTEFVGITGMVAVIGTQTGEVVSVISQLLWLDDAERAVAAECRAQVREQ